MIISWFNFQFDRPGHLQQQSHHFSKLSPGPNHFLPQYLIRLRRSGTDFLQILQKCGLNTFHPSFSIFQIPNGNMILKKVPIDLYESGNMGIEDIKWFYCFFSSAKILRIFLQCDLNISRIFAFSEISFYNLEVFNRCTQSQTICLCLQESNHWESHLDRLFLKQQEFQRYNKYSEN